MADTHSQSYVLVGSSLGLSRALRAGFTGFMTLGNFTSESLFPYLQNEASRIYLKGLNETMHVICLELACNLPGTQ